VILYNIDRISLFSNNLEIDIKNSDDKIIFPTQFGKKIPTEFAQSVYESLTKLISATGEIGLNCQDSVIDNRFGDFLYEKFNELVEKELKISTKNTIESNDQNKVLFIKEGFKNILNGLFLMRAKRENIRNGCSNIFDLSLKNFACYQVFMNFCELFFCL